MGGALWAVEAVFGIRWRLVVDFLVDIDNRVTVHHHWHPELYLSFNGRGVRVNEGNQPADGPLLTGRQLLSIGVGALPGVGSAQSVIELITGRDHISGEDVDRRIAAVGILAGIAPGGKALLKTGVKLLPTLTAKMAASFR